MVSSTPPPEETTDPPESTLTAAFPALELGVGMRSLNGSFRVAASPHTQQPSGQEKL